MSVNWSTNLIKRLQKLLRSIKSIRGHQGVSAYIKKYQGELGSIKNHGYQRYQGYQSSKMCQGWDKDLLGTCKVPLQENILQTCY